MQQIEGLKKAGVAAVFLALALLFTACGSEGEPSSGPLSSEGVSQAASGEQLPVSFIVENQTGILTFMNFSFRLRAMTTGSRTSAGGACRRGEYKH